MSKKTFQKHIKKAMVKVAFADSMNGKESLNFQIWNTSR